MFGATSLRTLTLTSLCCAALEEPLRLESKARLLLSLDNALNPPKTSRRLGVQEAAL